MKVCPECQAEYSVEVDYCPADGTKLRAKRGDTSEDPLIGRALDGRWVIEEKLGEGGMGAVYRGHQKSVSRTVAIKTLRPQLAESEEFVDRFFREAKIAATISHPHSVTILDYGETEDGTLFLAMEFLDGELLTDRLKSQTLTVKQVLEIGIQVSSALQAAHDAHIVHRDLKPDNIFLLDVPGGATFAKVLDFGIAKMLDSNTQVTKTGMIFGTPEYMSPEQCRGDQIDGRADLYALGCIMYELVGGRTPFQAATPMAVLLAHVNESAPRLSPTATMHLPTEVDAVIMRLLAKDPAQRYQDANALREALEDVLANLENPNRPAAAAVLPVLDAPVPTGTEDTVGLEAVVQGRGEVKVTDKLSPEPPKRSNGPLIGIAAFLLVLVGLSAFAISKMSSEPAPVDEPAAVPAEVVAEVAEAPPEPPVVETEPEVKEEPEPEPIEEPPTEVAAKIVAEDPPEQPKPSSKNRTKKKSEPKPDPEPEPEKAPEPPVVEKTAEKVPRVAVEPKDTKTASAPDEKRKKRRKTIKERIDDINEKTEKGKKKLDKLGDVKTYEDILKW